MSRSCQFPEGFFEFDFQFLARHAATPRESVRLLGLAFLQQNKSVAEVSDLLSVHPEAVKNWLKRFKNGGLDAMKEQPGRGRKPLLPTHVRDEFKASTQQLQAEKSGGSIVGRDIQEMLSDKFNTNCCLASCYNYLHQVDLSWISGRTKHPNQDLVEQDQFKKKFKDIVRQKVSNEVELSSIDVWFQDEARVGQHNTINRVWADKGTRPGLIRQQKYENAYIFGAVCPQRDEAVGLIMPKANAVALELHLDEIQKATPEGRHAVVIMDKAGYHLSKSLSEYENLTILFLPSYAPELNSAEQLWEWLRQHDLSIRAFDSYESIVKACCDAWNKLRNETGRLTSLCSRKWAVL